MTSPLDYTTTPVPDDAVLKISPSKFPDFVKRPHAWYRSEIMGESDFEYNTATVLGTVVHYCAEQAANDEEVDTAEIERFVRSKETKEDYDPEDVLRSYKAMAERLVNDYVHPNKDQYMGMEESHVAHIKNQFYAAGTLDVLQGTKNDCMIVDYKTYSSKTKPKAFAESYRYQLLVYAYILKCNGYNPTRIRLVYVNKNIDGGLSDKTGKPLKSYPPEVEVLTENIEQENFDYIESMLDLCVDSIQAAEAHPELLHVIFHDPRLKQ